MSVDDAARTDAELVTLAQGGNTRAFDELVRRYQDKVFRLCFKILRHEQDAAEALQDAFLSAYRGLPRFKAESTFSTWLYRIATNASLMKLRRRREGHVSYEQSQSPVEDAEPMAIADWSAQPLDDLLDAETRELIGREIAQLPENERTVFVLRDLMEQTNADVARELGITVAAVKSRLHRARVHLRDRMNRYFRERTARRGRGAP
ncbi:MAG TPA: sigma-70 family RNA polymerase sigma factor [Candidatus Eisenbacteria bacterium]|nr:sigma-70 family RNA polymerase sigma factor [Candidatus Eisenbacteria bacterium]